MEGYGRFTWFDLMTRDVAGAKAFYEKVAGWKSAPAHEIYDFWAVGDDTFGGVAQLGKHPRALGDTPHWLAYVATRDVDATARKAEELGGKILVLPTDIPAGRFAILADRQGAVFALFGEDGEITAPPRDQMGRFSWAELHTTDWEDAWRFYSELFGWKPTHAQDMGPEFGGTYFMFSTGGPDSLGGMSNTAALSKRPPFWLHYFNVADVDRSVALIRELGGAVDHGPYDIPGGDRVALCRDPQGAAFAIYASGRHGA